MDDTRESGHQSLARLLRALLALAVCLSVVGCSKSTKPIEPRYNLYISATGYHKADESSRFDQFYIYDADSLTLLDSMPLQTQATQLEVSPDGLWLYAVCPAEGVAPGALYKIDARSKQVVWAIPSGGGPISLLDNGKLLAWDRYVESDIIDAATGDIVTRLPSNIRTFKGPSAGTKVAAIVTDSAPALSGDTSVTVFDVRSGETHGRFVPRLEDGRALREVYTALLHPDGRHVLVLGSSDGLYWGWFMVGDFETGETLLRRQLTSPIGEIALSQDGLLAVVSDPPIGAMESPDGDGPSFLDLSTMQYLTTLRGESGLATYSPGQVKFLPGDHEIAFAGRSGVWTRGWAGPISIADRTTRVVEDTLYLPYEKLYLGALGVGPRP